MFDRDQRFITDRLVRSMQMHGIDAMLLTWPHSVYYATGFASSFLYTSRDMGLAAAVVDDQGGITLICSEFESQEARLCAPDAELIMYPMFVYVEDFAGINGAKKAQNDPLDTMRTAAGVIREKGAKRIAVEHDSLDMRRMRYLMETLPACEGIEDAEYFADAEPVMREAKRIKGPWEADIIREGTRISELAMELTGRELAEGMTHAEIANIYSRHCLGMRDDIIFVDQYHTYGPEFSPAYVLHDIPVKNGDMIRLDGGPVIAGYYSDIARNYCVGGTAFMTDRQKQIYEALYKGNKRGVEIIGPGVRLADVFNEVIMTVRKNGIPDYLRGHHGHSIGCGSNSEEAPFISAGEDGVLEPGMVMCLEASLYGSMNHSFNVEDTFLITENGAEWFSSSKYIL